MVEAKRDFLFAVKPLKSIVYMVNVGEQWITYLEVKFNLKFEEKFFKAEK